MRIRARSLVWPGVALLVAAMIAVALWPAPIAVDIAVVARGPLQVTIEEEGETRVADRYVVSAPVAGQVRRIDLEPGDVVQAGTTVVARFQPAPPGLLDARTRAEAESRAKAARAAIERARAARDQLQTERALAESEWQRSRELFAASAIARDRLDAAEAAARARADAVRAADSAVRAAQFELEAAEATLLNVAEATRRQGANMDLRAPVSGVVLRRLQESEAVVPAGTPLVEIGDRANLEIVADLLSSDAVRVAAGQRVIIDGWGGDTALTGSVRRVEPSAFTKISALGVEEQRVNVIIAFDDAPAAARALGDAYRVEVHIVLWEAADVLTVPVSALFRAGDDWAVFVVVDGVATRRLVRIDHRSNLEAEVVDGLAAGDVVVIHPSDAVADGAAVRPRPGAE